MIIRSIVFLAIALSACATQAPTPEPATPHAPATVQATPAQAATRVAAMSSPPTPVAPVTCLSDSQRAEYERRSSELFKSAFKTANPLEPSAANCAESKSGDLHKAGGCMAEAINDARVRASSAPSAAAQMAKSHIHGLMAQMSEYQRGLHVLRAEYPSCPAAAK